MLLHKPEEAIENFRDAIRYRHENYVAYNNLGDGLNKIGQYDKVLYYK
jgi:hypothetical protein